MKLGINTYTFMWSIGFKGVNPAFPQAHATPSNPHSLFDLLEIAHQQGLHVLQTGPNLPLDALPRPYLDRLLVNAARWDIEIELGTRGLDSDHIAVQARLAARCGALLIRTLPELNRQPLTNGEVLKEAIAPLVPILTQHDVFLGIENGNIPSAELAEALESVGGGRVGVVLDMVNSMAVAEGWKEVTRNLAGHVMCLHYKDFQLKRAWHNMGFYCEGVPAGKGLVDPLWLLETLQASRYDFNVILEQWVPEQETVDGSAALEHLWLEEGVRFLRQFVAD